MTAHTEAIPATAGAKTITAADLLAVLIECAGEPDRLPEHELSELTFEELGYDSLALIEAVARLTERHGVIIPDEDIAGLKTFGELTARSNG